MNSAEVIGGAEKVPEVPSRPIQRLSVSFSKLSMQKAIPGVPSNPVQRINDKYNT